MAIQKLSDYLKATDLGSAGLPQGDTYVDIAGTEILEGKNDEGKTTYKLNLPEGKSYFVPKNVMRDIQERAKDGAVKVRITRTGKTQTDTRYTVVKQ